MKISQHTLLISNNGRPTNPYSSKTLVQSGYMYGSVPNLSPAYYSPCFTAMKKREFEGTDKLVVEKFKAPIQSFKTHDDFNEWANKRCDEILKKDYTARSKEATIQRKAMLKEWRQYIYEENKEYSPAQRLLILDGVTKDLNKKNDNIPPSLNKRVLADTIDALRKDLKADPNKKDYNFNKTYQNSLRMFLMSDVEGSTGTDHTGWIVIPSKENDPVNFETNVEKLKAFSHQSWCTKSYNAEPYLRQGDFHVYLENGNPKLGVRFVGDEIKEIQGPKNNGKIPLKYYDMCKGYLDNNMFNLSHGAEEEIKHGQRMKDKYIPLIEEIKKSTPEEIFKKLEIEAEKDENGLFTISHFTLPDEMDKDGINYDDLEINLGTLLENVKEVKGNVDISNANIQSLPNLEKIGGILKLVCVKIGSLSKLKTIGKDVYFNNSKIKDLSGLTSIGGMSEIYISQIDNMSGLKTAGDSMHLAGSTIGDMSALTTVNGPFGMYYSKIGNLSSLSNVDRKVIIDHSEVGNRTERELRAIPKKKYKDLFEITKNGKPEEIFKALGIDCETNVDGSYSISHFCIPDDMIKRGVTNDDLGLDFKKLFENVKEVKGDVDFPIVKIESLPMLEKIGGNADFSLIKIDDLSTLKYIGGNAKFNGAEIKNLSGLEEICGNAGFRNTRINDLSGLKSIGGDADFACALIGNMLNLEFIKGKVNFKKTRTRGISILKERFGDKVTEYLVI